MAYQPKSYKKFVATAATATLVASAIVPVASANGASTAAFTDVSANYAAAVDYLVKNNIAQGLTETKFGIDSTIKRGDAAIMLAKALGIQDDKNAAPSGFSDVPARGTLAINSLKAAGIVSGKSTTNFGWEDNLTRGEVALLMANAKAYNLSGDVATLKFTDVIGTRYASAVAGMVKAGITSGKTATSFGTGDAIKRGDYAIFIYKAEGAPAAVTTATKVNTVSASNLKEVVVTFDGTVDKETAEDKANYSLKSGKAVKSVSLSEDKKAVTITVEGTLANNKLDAVNVSNVKAGDKVLNVKNVEFTTVDNQLPAVESIKSLGTKSLKVVFNEPVTDLKQTNFTLDGKAYFGKVELGTNNRSVILTPFSTSALAAGDHKVTISGVKDFAGFVSLASTHDFTVVEDKEAPTVVEASATLESVTLTFSEDVDPSTISSSKVYWKSGDSKRTATGTVEALADNKFKYTFSTNNSLPTGTVDIYVEGVKDYSGNEIAKDTKVSVQPEIDQTRPEVKKTSVVDATTIKVTFSKAINAASAQEVKNYTVLNKDGKVISVQSADLDPTDSKSVIIKLYTSLSTGENTLTIKNLKDNTKLQNTMLDYSEKIVRADKAAPYFDSKVVNKDDRRVVIKFNKKMNVDTLVDYSNYLVRINGQLQTLSSDVADISVIQDGTAVVITFAETINGNDVVFSSSPTPATGDVNVQELQVLGLKDTAGNLLKEFADGTNVIGLGSSTVLALADFDTTNYAGYKAELVDAETVKVKFNSGINAANTGAFSYVLAGVEQVEDVEVDGTSTVTVKFKNELGTEATALNLAIDFSKLVTIAGNAPAGSAVVNNANLLDSVAPEITDSGAYAVAGNKITITYSETLETVAGASQDLLDTDFNIVRVSDNKTLNPIGDYNVAVNGNKVEITLSDARTVSSAYRVTVDGADYFQDLSAAENAIEDSAGQTALVASNEALGLAALNTAFASPDTATVVLYEAAGVTGVTTGDLSTINTAAEAARTAKNSSLTKEEVQAVVNLVALNKALAIPGSATVAQYAAAGITGVTAANLAATNAAAEAEKVSKGRALTKAEIQAEVQ